MINNLKNEITDCVNCQSLALSVFGSLKKEDLHELNNYKNSNFVKKGQIIFSENNPTHGLFCIHKGKAKIVMVGRDGKEQIVRLAKDGDIIGYRSLICGENYSASAQTIEDSMVCFIPKEKLWSLIEKNAQLSKNLMTHLALDLKQAEQRSVNMQQKSASERLAEALLILQETFGINADKSINVELTREEIASLTGMAIETVVRILRDFQEIKMLDLVKKKIIILDHQILKRTANIED
jgi:CRP/FNR family transcriptional regulator, polysaccharide utilization system transcription regulator